MKYRLQFICKISKNNVNIFLNHFENIKENIYVPDCYTPVYIKKYIDVYSEQNEFGFSNKLITISPDSIDTDHSLNGEDFVYLVIDVSFTEELDLNELIDFIKTYKNLIEEVYQNRYFECRHDEQQLPMKKDGDYNNIDLL